MPKKIILFLSSHNDNAAEEHYHGPQGEVVSGAQTWEAPVKYLLQTYPDVSAVLCIVTQKARPAFPELEQVVAKQAPGVKVVDIPFQEKEDFNTGPLPKIMAEMEKGDEILLETTGGFRDAIMYLLLVSRVLSYAGIPTAGAVYSNYHTKQIEDCSQMIGLFNMVSGMQELASFGRVNELRSYYASRPHAKSIDRLLDATEGLWDSIALCRAEELDQKLEQFNEALAEAEGCTDPLIRQLLPTFTQKFGQELDIPGVIRWCVQNNMLLQALTIYTERIPAYLLGTTELLKIPPYKKHHSFPGGMGPVEYYNRMFFRDFLQMSQANVPSQPGAPKHQLRDSITTIKDIDNLIESSWFEWRGPKELLQPICVDYLYLKNVRNQISHSNARFSPERQEFNDYLIEIGHPPLTATESELKRLVPEALDRIQEAVAYTQRRGMKKFFTAVPLQHSPEGLNQIAYQPVGNTRLQMDGETSFPILTAVNGYVQPGEEFRLIAVMPDSEATRRNRDELSAQLARLCEQKGVNCPKGVETVLTADGQEVSAHGETFLKLLDYVDDNDELFSCMTFGTKPLSQAMLLALQYAYRVKQNASISCVVYGEVDRSGPKPWNTGKVYDMTALIQLDEVVHTLAERGVSDPKAALNAILTL